MIRKTRIMLFKELHSYFDSPIAYIFSIMFLVLTGAYFVSTLFLFNVSSLSTFYEAASLLFLFFAPAVTMRLISEERRTGTYESLSTKSITTTSIIVGKFFAAWFLIVGALLPTLIYAVTIHVFGTLDKGALISAYFGLVLLGGACVAVGLLGSTLSDSQIVAFIISFTLLFVLFFVDKVLLYVPLPIVSVAEFLGLNHHFMSMARGVLDTRDLLYYASVIVFSLLLATVFAGREAGQAIAKLREFSWREQISKLVVVFALLVFINLFTMKWFARVDLTNNQAFTLSETTRSLLDKLDDNFLVTAYFSPDLPPPYHSHRRIVQELLDEYRAYSHGRFHYQFVSPQANPIVEQEAIRAGIRPLQVKVIRNDQFQNARAFLGLSMSFEDKHERIPAVTSLDRLEYNITSCLKKMISRRVYTIGILVGKGGPEPVMLGMLIEALTRQYDVTTVSIKGGVPVPLNVSVLLVVSPSEEFTEPERFQLDQFIMHGGRLAFFIDGYKAGKDANQARPVALNLADQFDTYGFSIHSDLVLDSRCATITMGPIAAGELYEQEVPDPLMPVASEYNPHNLIVSSLGPVTFNLASSIDTRLSSIRRISSEIIITTSARSGRIQGESIDVDPRQQPASDELKEQHIPLAATFEGSFQSHFAGRRDLLIAVAAAGGDTMQMLTKSVPTRMVVVGDGDFLVDSLASNIENYALATNLVDWLVNDVTLTAVRSKDLTPRPLTDVTEQTKNMVKYFNFVAPPLMVVVIGIIRVGMRAARRRRHKASF